MQRGAREANPIFAGRSAIQQALIKSAGIGAVIGLASLVESRQRPVLAHVVRVIWIAVNTAITIHNAGVLR